MVNRSKGILTILFDDEGSGGEEKRMEEVDNIKTEEYINEGSGRNSWIQHWL